MSALYPGIGRPYGLKEESWHHAKVWEIFWNESRLVTTKRTRWVPNINIFHGKMEDIKPTEGKREEYYEEELITFKTDGIFHVDRYKWRMDSEDFSLYSLFDSTERKIESRKKVPFMHANRWRDLFKKHWESKVEEKRENEKIRKHNEKLWQEHYSLHTAMEKHRPRGLFWPF